MQNKIKKKKFLNKERKHFVSVKVIKKSRNTQLKIKNRIQIKNVKMGSSNRTSNSRRFVQFTNNNRQKRISKIKLRSLKRKIIWFKKVLYFRFFSAQHKYIIRFYLTKRNLFFVCTNFWGDVIFWFTSKQLGFRKYQLKSPYTIDAFYSLFLYYLKLNKIINFNIMLLGYNRHIKRFIKDLSELDFTINNITRYIPLSYNGCKRKHRRRL